MPVDDAPPLCVTVRRSWPSSRPPPGTPHRARNIWLPLAELRRIRGPSCLAKAARQIPQSYPASWSSRAGRRGPRCRATSPRPGRPGPPPPRPRPAAKTSASCSAVGEEQSRPNPPTPRVDIGPVLLLRRRHALGADQSGQQVHRYIRISSPKQSRAEGSPTCLYGVPNGNRFSLRQTSLPSENKITRSTFGSF
ncbi:hypothetical protein L1887_52103 [Cichorium endivia]|nr:hypothetical protein L1887_52103 [Cichorium endivia]